MMTSDLYLHSIPLHIFPTVTLVSYQGTINYSVKFQDIIVGLRGYGCLFFQIIVKIIKRNVNVNVMQNYH